MCLSGPEHLNASMPWFVLSRISVVRIPPAVRCLLVEDSFEYTSFFLPQVYNCIDAAFPGVRRPKLVPADSHETAMARFRELGERLECVICDTRLPRQGKESPEAGIDFLSTIHRQIPALPIMLMSAESINKTKAQRIPAPFLDKNGRRPDRVLHDFFCSLAADRPCPGAKPLHKRPVSGPNRILRA